MRSRGYNLRRAGLFRLFFLSVIVTVSSLVVLSDARAGTLVIDDFENPASSEKLWAQSSDAILNIVTDPAKAHSGSRVNEMVYVPNWNGPGFMNHDFSPIPEVYVRWYEKYSPGWVWSEVATKGIFLLSNSGNPIHGVVTGVGFNDPIYKADVSTTNNLESGVAITDNVWWCFEVRWNAHTGKFQMWINDTLRIDANTEPIPTQFGISSFVVSGYYNDALGRSCDGIAGCGVQQRQTRWVDDIAVSTTRIGCLPNTADKTPPSAPTGVRINTQ